MLESWKRAKFETHAHYAILKEYGFSTERLGRWDLAKITDDIFGQMKNESKVSESRYLELLVKRLKSDNHI